jgi:hypothetical protein
MPDAFTLGNSGESPLYRNSASITTEHAFSETAYFSATGATLSATTSGIFDGLSGTSGTNIVVFGWAGAFEESSTDRDHCIFTLEDEDAAVKAILHTSTDTNGPYTLRQPIKVKTGSPLIYRVISEPSKAADVVHFSIFYTRI